MIDRSAPRKLASDLRARFEALGAVPVEPPFLLSADTLLDLYGEDIRGRAYVTSDPARGEMFMRPDFTVPVVQMHMAQGAEPARYTYSGEVFRRQEEHPDRAIEFLQVGYEVFDRADPVGAEAEVFARIAEALAPMGLKAVIGDIGLLRAAIEGLDTTQRRKSALLRHIWHPRRFRALLDRFAGRAPVPAAREALLNAADPMAHAGPMIGLRSAAEIEARIAALREDAATAPISEGQLELIEALLEVRETAPYALEQLRDLAVDMPSISKAVERMAARNAALADMGIDLETLSFEATYGRTSMEYYDGFVFGLIAEDRPDLPPVASGGRYDALTSKLGQGREIPAVGGVIRPGLVLDLGGLS
ncbi:ATP phosphoribosyltransferase regulatory subunit [Donghicola sp. C2-DW-16]|uniref:Histidine--tRNA ligase n=1 Tax=Donghicola mangrovi TaxID=2729614 RepID=A0ABX2PCG4_9RHOB|nr:ATP phosphoribosyltransferase regulatory subunit [Donghicola mangrovi]NVO26722.1 ATP phosphoribosyltransferase regulatory subunit [Donghicola mangrovi]